MLDRRDFLKMAATISTAFGISNLPEPVSAALKRIEAEAVPKLIYLQGLSCSGCSVSLLQATLPSPLSLITDYSRLVFHADLSAATGSMAMEIIDRYISGNGGEYFLALEGAIPGSMPEACLIGERTLEQYLLQASATMSGAIAVGSCASYGGIPGAEGNLTGAVSLRDFFKKRNIDKLVINIPGCSVHPDWVWLTIIHLVKIGLPELVEGRPKIFFGRKVHELCSRYHDFQQEFFATKLGDKGCLFKLGCLGPDSFADCPVRGWNGGTSSCVDANSPCIGCVMPGYARRKDFPFYRVGERRA